MDWRGVHKSGVDLSEEKRKQITDSLYIFMRYKGFGRVGRIYEHIKEKINFLGIVESA